MSDLFILIFFSDATHVFKTTLKMSTYLVAFVVSQFKTSAINEYVKIWSRPGALNQAQFAQSVAQDILESIGGFTGLKYNEYLHMEKMDMVAIPDFAAGAMENWGLLTYR